MNPYRTDLNLLNVFHAIYETRSVTLAAQSFGITQPAMSNALSRLRDLLGDPLFVHMPQGMVPTPYAAELFAGIDRGIQEFRAALAHHKRFDPRSSTRTFRFHLTDMGQFAFLPPVLERFHDMAPGVRIEAESLPVDKVVNALEEGHVDVALGHQPKLARRGLRSHHLFNEHYQVLMRVGHPLSGRLDRKAFLGASHAAVRSAGGSHGIIEKTLLKHKARVAVRVPYFMVIPMIMARTDVLATVPSRLAQQLAATGDFQAAPLPVTIPSFDVGLFWHDRFDADPANRWLREQLISLFAEAPQAAA
jgi:DNA-binding transcriptional LysR family regulator